jgi:hypothetical protein
MHKNKMLITENMDYEIICSSIKIQYQSIPILNNKLITIEQNCVEHKYKYRCEVSYWHLVKRQIYQVDVSVFMLLQLNAFSCSNNLDITRGIMLRMHFKQVDCESVDRIHLAEDIFNGRLLKIW